MSDSLITRSFRSNERFGLKFPVSFLNIICIFAEQTKHANTGFEHGLSSDLEANNDQAIRE